MTIIEANFVAKIKYKKVALYININTIQNFIDIIKVL